MKILCFVGLLPLSARQPWTLPIEPDARACQSVQRRSSKYLSVQMIIGNKARVLLDQKGKALMLFLSLGLSSKIQDDDEQSAAYDVYHRQRNLLTHHRQTPSHSRRCHIHLKRLILLAPSLATRPHRLQLHLLPLPLRRLPTPSPLPPLRLCILSILQQYPQPHPSRFSSPPNNRQHRFTSRVLHFQPLLGISNASGATSPKNVQRLPNPIIPIARRIATKEQ